MIKVLRARRKSNTHSSQGSIHEKPSVGTNGNADSGSSRLVVNLGGFGQHERGTEQ